MNIYDVSRQAQVSIATVSRVINGNPNVSEKTRKRVLQVMDELGYTPNIFARSLGLNTMKTIGVMCADSSDPYLANAIYYLEQALRRNGYNSLLCCSGYLPDNKKKCLELLLSKRVDGVILAGSQYIESKPQDNNYLLEAAKQLPIMLVNGALEGKGIYSTICDDRTAIFKAANSLMISGHSHILFLYSGSSYSSIQKLKGYHDACSRAGLPHREDLICSCPKDLDETVRLLCTVAARGVLFNAVLASEDIMAVGAVKYAHRAGLSVPDDLSIIGYNNSTLARCADPEISSIDNKVEDLCNATVNTLMKVLEGETVPSKTVISGELIQRGTTNF